MADTTNISEEDTPVSEATNEAPAAPHPAPPPALSKRLWQKFGGDGFLISLALHIILAMVAIFWVIKTFVISEPPKEDNTFATGQGGGNQGDRAKIFEHRIQPKHAKSLVSTPRKLTVANGTGIALPDMPDTDLNMLSGESIGGSSKGLGGGSGGGIGTGKGVGIGNGKNFVANSPLGNFTFQANTLEGTLYDLKKTNAGRPRYDISDHERRVEELKSVMIGLPKSRFRKQYLDGRYFQAPQKLYTSHISIPPMDAETATSAFNCEDSIKAPGWLAYYEGWISPPETGEYRFAGMGDDAMMVALDQKLVLWAFWPQHGRQTWFKAEKDWEPQNAYTPNGSVHSTGSGARYFGSWFKLEKGRSHRVQIIFAEATGGLFSAEIQIQKKTYATEKAASNDTKLSLFKLAPITEEELRLKGKSSLQWTSEGPDFGCEINGVKPPRSVNSTR